MKIVVLGNSKTGKSTWINQLNNIKQRPRPTLGVEVHPVSYKGIKHELWDTGFGGIREAYFLGASCAFILYTNPKQIEKYKAEIRNFLQKDIPVVAFNLSEIENPRVPFQLMFN